MNGRNEREELKERLEAMTPSQWESFISAALPLLRELALRELHRLEAEE